MPKQRPMLVSSHGFSKRYSHQGIRSILSNEFGNRLMELTAAHRSLRGSKGGQRFWLGGSWSSVLMYHESIVLLGVKE